MPISQAFFGKFWLSRVIHFNTYPHYLEVFLSEPTEFAILSIA